MRARRHGLRRNTAIIRLCLLMLAFYFCVYLARPFFTLYWEQLGGPQASWITGLVYAIPGMLALLALALHYHAGQHLTAWLLLGAAGLALQGVEQMPLLLAGRVLFGWALYQLTVALDARLFALSRPEHYGRDYSLINIFQNLGVLTASWLAGVVVRDAGLAAPFLLSALGLVHRMHPALAAGFGTGRGASLWSQTMNTALSRADGPRFVLLRPWRDALRNPATRAPAAAAGLAAPRLRALLGHGPHESDAAGRLR